MDEGEPGYEGINLRRMKPVARLPKGEIGLRRESKMRELLLKNLTSLNRRRKILSLSEVFSKDGVLTRVNRSFIYLVREVPQPSHLAEKPEFFIFKIHDSKLRQESFLLKIKGNFYVSCKQKIYLINYCHSLRIALNEQVEEVTPEKS